MSRGRPPVYPIQSLEVGQSVLVPWRVNAEGSRVGVDQFAIRRAVRQYGKRAGKRFGFEPCGRGLHVRRLPQLPPKTQ